MNPSQELTAERIAIMQAYVDGKEIEFTWRDLGKAWVKISDPTWDWSLNDYRIKPKPSEVYVVEGTQDETGRKFMTSPFITKEGAARRTEEGGRGWTYRIIKYREVVDE